MSKLQLPTPASPDPEGAMSKGEPRTSGRTSYRDVLERVAKRHDFEITHFPTTTAQILAEDAAALRQLAALIDRMEQKPRSLQTWLAFSDALAAGYRPEAERK